MKKYPDSESRRLIVIFLIGSIFLSALWKIQEILLGSQTNSAAYILPVLFGGLSTVFIYYFYKKHSQKEKELKENRYKKLFNNINNAVAIYKPINNGKDFKLMDINFKGVQMSDLKKGEVSGKKFKELSLNKDFAELINVFKEVQRTGQSKEYLLEVYEQGKLKTYQQNYVYKLRSGEIINIYEDLTELKLQEKKIKNKNELLEGLMDNLTVGITVIDKDKNIRHLNKGFTKITGYTKEDLKTLNDWFNKAYPDPEYREKVQEVWKKKSKKESSTRDFEVVCKDGTKKFLHFRVNYAGDKYIISLLDLSEKIKLRNQLEEKKDYLKKIISNIPEILLILDEKGEYLDIWTSQHEDLVGPASELKGKGINDILPSNVAKKYIKNIETAIKTNEQQTFEYSLMLNDQKKYFEAKLILLDNKGENKTQILVLINNITDRVKKSRILKNTKERLELIINATDLGIFDVDFRAGNVIVNRNIHKLTGYSKKNIDNYINFWLDKIHEDDKNKVIETITSHINSDKTFFNVVHRIKTKEGNYRWFRLIGNLIESNNIGDPIRVVGILQDINQRKLTHIELREQKAHFEQLFANSIEGIALLDSDCRVIKTNSKFQEIFGYKSAEVKGKKIDSLITPAYIKDKALEFNKQVMKGKEFKKEVVRKKKDGTKINVSVHGFSVDLTKDKTGIYAVYNDITQRKKIENRIKYLSYNDELTDLYNRRYFDNELEKMNNSRRRPISIIVGDLDRLKKINDTYGHSEGDRYLKSMAKILKHVVRDEDIVARLGGDEFAILLPETNKKSAVNVCNRIKEECAKLSDKREYPIPLNISLGYNTIHSKGEDLYTCLNKADKKMYNKKGKSLKAKVVDKNS